MRLGVLVSSWLCVLVLFLLSGCTCGSSRPAAVEASDDWSSSELVSEPSANEPAAEEAEVVPSGGAAAPSAEEVEEEPTDEGDEEDPEDVLDE